ncbi:MAG: flavin reductase family protein [Lachnospiraceae bacterium]|nr:flavin reductase family protein [Lachnospiraceae bacterium]
MDRQIWKPGNMLYPLPVVLVTCSDGKGNSNIFTVAWTGTVCSDPPMVSISVRPQRYSHSLIHDTGEFVINLTTRRLVFATDYCGVRSGRDVDKFREMKLTALPAQKVGAPLIGESPVNIECRVSQVIRLGSHDMFLANVEAVHAQEAYMDEKGRFFLDRAQPVVYSHGTYYALGKAVGSFGYSVKKQGASRKKK